MTRSAPPPPAPTIDLARWWREVDRVALAAMGALLLVGLLCSLAASPAAASRLDLADPFYFFRRHVVFAAASATLIVAVSMLPALQARRLAVLALLGALGLLAATLVVGAEVNEARRWLTVAGVSVQPAEIAKPAFVVTAAWLIGAGKETGAAATAAAGAVAVYAVLAALLLVQPDFGQTVLLAFVLGGLAFLAGAPWRLLAVGAGGAGLLAAGVGLALPHVAARVRTFLSPDPGYQTGLAIEAVARGGLFGVGPGEGTVKRALPEAHTDFIFAVAAEEFGLVFTLALIGLLATVVLRLLLRTPRVSSATSSVPALAAGGLALLIGGQGLVNIAVNLNLLPPKGMTLPFVSYGGSSLLALGFTGGLALAFTRRPAGDPAVEAGRAAPRAAARSGRNL